MMHLYIMFYTYVTPLNLDLCVYVSLQIITVFLLHKNV